MGDWQRAIAREWLIAFVFVAVGLAPALVAWSWAALTQETKLLLKAAEAADAAADAVRPGNLEQLRWSATQQSRQATSEWLRAMHEGRPPPPRQSYQRDKALEKYDKALEEAQAHRDQAKAVAARPRRLAATGLRAMGVLYVALWLVRSVLWSIRRVRR